MAGYHLAEIPQGKYGEFSKVVEEWCELVDSRGQGNRIMELCELADLVGAIEGYVEAQYSLSIDDVVTMMRATRKAFLDGTRKMKG